MKCPRRSENSDHMFPGEDQYDEGLSCSYCGSLNPDVFMARLEEQTIELGPTDKNYKVYYKVTGGAPISVRGAAKFYFQHLSEEQRKRFVGLLNEKKLAIGFPGHFYSLPFFIKMEV